MELRPYQNECISAIVKAYDQGWRQQIASLATGTGKTVIFSALYEAIKPRLPGQMIVVAHTEELIEQNLKTMREVNPTLKVDKEMAETKADPSTADIIVASVATLGRKNTTRLDKYDKEKFDKLVVDEMHHSTADSYLNVLNAFDVLKLDTPKLLLGVTATPTRADNKALGEIYKKMVYLYPLRQAITDGWLVKIRGYRVGTKTDLSKIKMQAGDFDKIELSQTVNTPDRNQRVVEAWRTQGENRLTVVYAVDIKHAQDLGDTFCQSGIAAQAIWGDDSARASKLESHRHGDIRVLVNCSLLIEGWDSPEVSCIVLAAPTCSSVRFTQMCGRATRLYPGKTDCIVLDLVDNSSRHSLCTLPTLMGLPVGLDVKGHGLVEAIETVEEYQLRYPNIDFTKLKDIDTIPYFIEQVNMFELRFPPEVESNSELAWSKTIEGKYAMNIPRPKMDTTGTKSGRVQIYEDMLGQWEIEALLKGKKFKGYRGSIEEAFAAADQLIRDQSPESVNLLRRGATWKAKPATKNQMVLLHRLYKGKVWPDDLTQGQASFWIDKKIGGRV